MQGPVDERPGDAGAPDTRPSTPVPCRGTGDDRLWVFRDDGQADVAPEDLPEVCRERTEDPTEPTRDIGVGAVDTGEHGPSEGTRPLHMVRRRVFHLRWRGDRLYEQSHDTLSRSASTT